VLIVGGGPAGLSVAEALPASLSKVVLHQDRAIGLPVRTSGGTWVRDMQSLGVPGHLYHPIDEIEFASDTHSVARQLRDWRMAVLDITGLYQWIAQRAKGNGAQIFTGVKFTGITDQGPHYLCTCRDRDGTERQIKARYVVDASGLHCAVMSAMGLGARPTRVGVGVEYDFHMPQGVSNRAVLLVGAQALSGYGWIFPAPNNTLRIGVGVIQPDTDVSPRTLMQNLITPQFLERHDLQLGEQLRSNAGIIPSIPYERRLVYDRVIRCGDSANFATPTVGEGIRQAMEFGRLLGQRLGQSLTSNNPAPLRAYERAARRRFARDYRLGFMTNQRMAQYTPDDWERSIRRIARLSEHEMAMLLRSEFTPRALLRTAAKQLWHKITR
jgi:digeranylgeranylglycerophospholipid reductase